MIGRFPPGIFVTFIASPIGGWLDRLVVGHCAQPDAAERMLEEPVTAPHPADEVTNCSQHAPLGQVPINDSETDGYQQIATKVAINFGLGGGLPRIG